MARCLTVMPCWQNVLMIYIYIYTYIYIYIYISRDDIYIYIYTYIYSTGTLPLPFPLGTLEHIFIYIHKYYVPVDSNGSCPYIIYL